jgi:DNA (cytosine-5)-methyltransferase 1
MSHGPSQREIEDGDPNHRIETAVMLLPTPLASDGEKGGPNQRGGAGDLRLSSAVQPERLLPTPTVVDRGAGKTVQAWDQWTAEMQARHGNGNGHGPSLAIEALRMLPTPMTGSGGGGIRSEEALASGQRQVTLNDLPRLLPTPTATDSKASGGSTPADVTLTDAIVRTSLGAHTNPRFADGKPPSDGPRPRQLILDGQDNPD